jgi:hypothetical protein
MFSKFLAISMAILITLSVPGMKFFAHYCKGNLKDISFVDGEDPCHKKNKEKSCCSHTPKKNTAKQCCTSSKESSIQGQTCALKSADCCETKVVANKNLKLNSLRFPVQIESFSSVVVFLHSYFNLNINTLSTASSNYNLFGDVARQNPDIRVWVCSFLI